MINLIFFFFQVEDVIRDKLVTGVQTCALPIFARPSAAAGSGRTPDRDAGEGLGGAVRGRKNAQDTRSGTVFVPAVMPPLVKAVSECHFSATESRKRVDGQLSQS